MHMTVLLHFYLWVYIRIPLGTYVYVIRLCICPVVYMYTTGRVRICHTYIRMYQPVNDGSSIFAAEVDIALAQLLACLDVLDPVFDCLIASRPRI